MPQLEVNTGNIQHVQSFQSVQQTKSAQNPVTVYADIRLVVLDGIVKDPSVCLDVLYTIYITDNIFSIVLMTSAMMI